jgi:hypothetical protein
MVIGLYAETAKVVSVLYTHVAHVTCTGPETLSELHPQTIHHRGIIHATVLLWRVRTLLAFVPGTSQFRVFLIFHGWVAHSQSIKRFVECSSCHTYLR